METITLPDSLIVDATSTIAIHYYKSNQEIRKQQIVLTKNVFSFLLKGTKEVVFNNATNTIDKKQFLLMKSGHCLMTEKLSNTSKQYHSVLLFFSNQLLTSFIDKYNLSPKPPKNTQASISFDYDEFTHRYVKSILDILKLSSTAQKNILTAKFEEIMLYLIELKGTEFLYSLTHNNKHLNFTEVVENNKLKKLSIQELSFLFNMSESTFKREFKKHYNTSPSKWFSNKRLEHAALLLKNGDCRPSEIYEEIGYENLSNFIHAFKLKFGITPKQFQKT